MKKSYLFLALAVSLVVMCSCSGNGAANVVKEFVQAAAANDSVKMVQLYPDAKSFPMISLNAEDVSVDVESVEGQEDTYKAMLNNSIELIVKKSGDNYQITSSRGLLALPENMEFAKGTGQYKADLSDVENNNRLNDKDFVSWVLKDLESTLGEKVKVVKSDFKYISRKATDWFDESHSEAIEEKYTAEIRVTVQNDLDSEISADAYSVVSSVYTEAYFNESAKCAKTTDVSTLAIPANSSVELTYQFSGSGDNIEGMGWINHIKSTLSLNYANFDVSSLYTPKGGEYDEYLKTRSDN